MTEEGRGAAAGAGVGFGSERNFFSSVRDRGRGVGESGVGAE
jgi:hypothetical protein